MYFLTLRRAGAQAVEGTLVSAISFVKTLASTHQHELDLLRSQVGLGLECAPCAARWLPRLRPGALRCRERAQTLGVKWAAVSLAGPHAQLEKACRPCCTAGNL